MKLPKGIRGAVFDLDGTLLDSLNAWRDVDRRFFEAHGLPLPDDFFDAIKTLDITAAAVYTKERYAIPASAPDIVDEWRRLIGEEYALRIDIKPYALPLLEALAAAGVRCAVATSSAPELFLPALERLGAAGYFSAFVTTQEAGKGKEFPDVYLEAARRIGVPPHQCAVFEDLPEGIGSAKAGGFFTVGVFDPHSADVPRMRKLSDLYVTSFSELL